MAPDRRRLRRPAALLVAVFLGIGGLGTAAGAALGAAAAGAPAGHGHLHGDPHAGRHSR